MSLFRNFKRVDYILLNAVLLQEKLCVIVRMKLFNDFIMFIKCSTFIGKVVCNM